MATGSLPHEGEVRLGTVRLPAGKRVTAGYDAAVPVAWVTHQEVADPGRVWAALSASFPETGLVPFLLGGLHGDATRPWDTEEFHHPCDPAELDQFNAAEVLREMWDGEMPSDEEDEEEGAPWAQMRAPFSKHFPGLAAAGDTPLSPGQLDDILGSLPPRRVGLAPAGRPADVLPQIGWTPSDQSDALPIAAVVRSWEDRFGARLLEIGFAEFRLLASRPPRSTRHAQHLAAEQFAFCDECAGKGLRDISKITDHLLTSPIWTFWWD